MSPNFQSFPVLCIIACIHSFIHKTNTRNNILCIKAQIWELDRNSALPPNSYENLGELLNFAELQFPYL